MPSSEPNRVRAHLPALLALLCLCVLVGTARSAEHTPDHLSWSTDATQPARFIAVHGRRSAFFGYSADGLEAWAYPLQILSSFSVAFAHQGATTEIDGRAVLRRVIYEPERVTRIYAGPDFVVREKLFVPLDAPGAIVTYEVEGVRAVDVVVRFLPVLDLMWPGGMGGQETTWDPAASAYVISEPTHRFTALVGSPDTVAHDETPNANRRVARSAATAFTIRAGKDRAARVVIATADGTEDAATVARRLLNASASLERAAADHYAKVLNSALQIETPDPEVNRALAWSEVALEQAWVCNPDIGCGVVAGYGPSRKARRPQYDWFFAGDGMVATRALLAAGRYERAREELEFILKYRNKDTGMIWHEMSQSAGVLDWKRYPYMFVHVDLTYDFLDIAAEYYSVTGDVSFVKKNWAAFESAYRYCRSLLDAKDGLPRIPSDKQGLREQDALSDELTLSAAWVSAAEGFSRLAPATGHNAAAKSARDVAQRARKALSRRYWDEGRNFWISGHTRSGAPLMDRDIRPAGIIEKSLLSPEQRRSVLDQLASHEFQTDWGTRGKASSDSAYDPNSYASGSVWAVATSAVAGAFWFDHRPATAWPIWSALVPWSSLDSLGHMHETLAGDFYHEELESVPEQTWSSASFFTTAVNGLLGLKIDGVSRRLTFAPHLPPQWNGITLRHVRVNGSDVTLEMTQSADELRLKIENAGEAVAMQFAPQLPYSAKLRDVQIGSRKVPASLDAHAQDTHALVDFTVPHGSTSVTIGYEGGVAIIPVISQPMVGDPSNAVKFVTWSLHGPTLTIELDHLAANGANFELRTPWKVAEVGGADFQPMAPSRYRFTIKPSASEGSGAFKRSRVTVTLPEAL